MKLYVKKTSVLLSFLYMLISTGVALLILSDISRPEYYRFLWVLPCVFGIVVCVSSLFLYNAWSNLYFVLICFVFSIRNVITPLFMRFGDYEGYFRVVNESSVNKGIVLMLFESTVLLSYAAIKSGTSVSGRNRKADITRSGREGLFFVFCLICICGTWIFRRDFFSGFTTILGSTDIRTVEVVEGTEGPLYTLFSVLFPIAYLFICLYLMSVINRKLHNIFPRRLCNIFLICVPLLFMNNSDGFTLICMACLAFSSLKMNGIKKGTFFIIVVGLICSPLGRQLK